MKKDFVNSMKRNSASCVNALFVCLLIVAVIIIIAC